MEQDIESLNLSKGTLARLKQMGYSYVCDIKEDAKEKLCLNVDFPSLLKAPETKTAFEIYNEELLSHSILSYNENLDMVLTDAIRPKTICELAGESGSGKTQVCFLLSISVQLPKWCGGMQSEAIYLDTNSNFASHRLTELARDFVKKYNSIKSSADVPSVSFDEMSILQHIYYTKPCDIVQFMACIKKLEMFLPIKNVRLIIIDSFSFIVRMVDMKERKAFINRILCDLRSLSQKHNLAVVFTNDLTTRVNKGEAYMTPSFGDSLYHLVNTRIVLSKKNTFFQAKLEKNFMHNSEKYTIFYL